LNPKNDSSAQKGCMGCPYISKKGRDERYLSEFIHYDDLYAIEPSTLLLEVVDRSIAFPFTSLIVISHS